MWETLLASIALGFAMLFVLMVGVYSVSLKNLPDLKACAKQHNVYQCELVAVPKEQN